MDISMGDLFRRKRDGCLEIPLAMGYGTRDGLLRSFCPDAVLRDRLERDPATFEMPVCVKG